MRAQFLLACGSLIGAIACADVAAQNYPVEPVRIIVPTPAGGNPDFIARPVAQKMSESLRQTFIIDNRPGAAGTIGVELATRAVPEVRDLFERAGIIPVGSTPEQFAQQVRGDIAKFGKVAREAGIRAE